jgi:thiol:disulfide interchange protein
VLAGIVIGVKAAGQKAGWGMQFSNPQFIVILTLIVTLVALNLFGVFEVTLSGRAVTAASDAASRHGSGGAFMNGVLATVLATPCTAPFLGAALGFAFAQPSHIIVLFFVTIGLGLALPYLLLSWNPKWLKFLPRPGAWMERFKVGMGFPMLATAIWLFSLTSDFYRDRVLWLGLFLIVVACAAWIFGEFVQRGSKRRGVAIALVLLLLAGGYAYAIEHRLRWRSPVEETAGEDTIQESPDGIVWRRWSPQSVAAARAEGRPVFVDFTAKWCLTCQLNKNSSIEISSVRKKLKEINAVALLADNTKYPPAISAELEKFGRAGVPMVLVYPKDATKAPIVLPEILTPGIVLNALDEAAK